MAKTGYSRRAMLKGGAAMAAASAFPAPMLWAQTIKDITLRQFGTGVSNLNDVANKVKEDLGFTLSMTALDSDAVTQRAATQPDSFDIADIEYWICKKVWPTGNLQAMDTSKIKNYDKIVGIFKSGKLTPESVIAQGTAPHTVGFVDGPDGKSFRQGRDRLDDADPDDLQCRYAGHPPGSDRSADRKLGGTGQPRVQGQGQHPRHLVDRHHGLRHGLRGLGRDQVWRQGQHDPRRDRQDHGDDDRVQEGRPVPRRSGRPSTKAST